MASPFTSFRKNQKAWLAFLGVVCMVTFVIAPNMKFGCGQSEQYAVKTPAIEVTWAELQLSVQERQVMNRFADMLEQTRQKAAEKKTNASGFELQFRPDRFGGETLHDAFDTRLKVQKAQDLGITISQNTVTEYITTRSGGALSTQQLNDFLRENQMSQTVLYAALSKELLAQRVDELYGFGRTERFELTPAEHKDVWDRQHRRAHIQALPLKVAEFARLVPEPSDEDLKQFFEAARDRIPDPDSPEVGFGLPLLAQFEYLQVSTPRFFKAAMKAIAPEEIGHRYEAEKGKKVSAPFMNYSEDEWKRELKEEEKAKEKADEKSGADAKKASDPKKAGDTKSGDEKAKPDAKSGGAAVPPPSRAPREAAGAYPVALRADGQGEASAGVLLAQADPAKTTPESKTAAGKTTDPKTTGGKTVDPKTGDAKTAEAKTADAKTGADAKQPAKTADAKQPAETPGSPGTDPFKSGRSDLNQILNDLTIPDDIRQLQPGQNPPTFKPLWQVDQKLREELARDMQNSDSRRLLDLIKKPLDEYASKYVKWSNNKKKSDQNKPVNPLADEANVRKIINEAWETLAKEKNDAWKKTFDERRKFVDEAIKGLAEDNHLTAEQFKKLAADTKNANWQRLLQEQQRLVDTDKLTNEALKTWQDLLSVKRTNLPGDVAAEKKAEKSAGEKAADPKKDAAKKDDAKKDDAKKDDAKKDEPTQPVIALEKTGRGRDRDGREEEGLDLREFLRRKYPLAEVRLASNKRFIDEAFTAGQLFQPQLGSNSDDQFLLWRIDERPARSLTWEDPKTKEIVPATRAIVLEKYRETQARDLALKKAQELADKIGREAQKFPTAEVQRLFRLDLYDSTRPMPEELTAKDRQTLAFSEVAAVYTVVVELFEDGQRERLHPHVLPAIGPLEAPAPGELSGQPWIFAEEEQARQFAIRLARDERNPKALAIVGRSVGEIKPAGDAPPQRVFQGVEGFRWQEKSGGAEGAKDADIVSGPGRLAGRTFSVEITPGDPPLKVTGVRVAPFTWNELPNFSDDKEIAGLVLPGSAFGETVFRLAPGELGAALNRPQSIAYVVQVTGFDYSFGPNIYPVDTTAETSPLHERFIASYRSAGLAERRYAMEVEQYRANVAQFPHLAQMMRQPNAPQSVLYAQFRARQEWNDWRNGLYREYGVTEKQIQGLAERGSRE